MNWSWWYLVLLIPLTMLILIVMTSFKQPSQLRINWGWLVGILVLALIGWGVWWFIHRETKKEDDKSTTPTTQIIRVGREKRLYLFSDFPDGIIRAKIELGEVDFYPKGGKVKITPPLPATPWEDEPGTTMPRVERPPGWYTITKVNPNATGVEIWN